MSSNAMALALAGLALTTGALADVSTASWSEGAVHAGMHLSMAAMAPMDASSNEAFVASLKPILARELAVSEAQLVVSAVAAEPVRHALKTCGGVRPHAAHSFCMLPRTPRPPPMRLLRASPALGVYQQRPLQGACPAVRVLARVA